MVLDESSVGLRVVVRYLLGEPDPRATDVLGTLVSCDDATLTVLSDRAGDELVRVPRERVVAGRPVPPRTTTLLRMRPERLQLICDAGWPAVEVLELGQWRLRAAGGFTGRANSVLPAGDPGLPLPEALAAVRGFYARRRLEPLVQVVVGSALEHSLAAAGWMVARDGDGVLVQVASIGSDRRSPGARGQPVVRISATLTDGWTRLYGRTADAPRDAVHAVLAGPDTVAFASIEDPPVAVGRGVVVGDWLGLSSVEVVAGRRRAGLGRAAVDALLAWGTERGARSAYLQATPDNHAALALYAPYGFVTHHRYRYWAPAQH